MASTTWTTFPQSLVEFPYHRRASTPTRNSLSETVPTPDRRNPDKYPVMVSGEETDIPILFDPNPASLWHQSNELPRSAITICYAGLYKEDMPPLIIAKHRFRIRRGEFRIIKFAIFLRPGTAATKFFTNMIPRDTPIYFQICDVSANTLFKVARIKSIVLPIPGTILCFDTNTLFSPLLENGVGTHEQLIQAMQTQNSDERSDARLSRIKCFSSQLIHNYNEDIAKCYIASKQQTITVAPGLSHKMTVTASRQLSFSPSEGKQAGQTTLSYRAPNNSTCSSLPLPQNNHQPTETRKAQQNLHNTQPSTTTNAWVTSLLSNPSHKLHTTTNNLAEDATTNVSRAAISPRQSSDVNRELQELRSLLNRQIQKSEQLTNMMEKMGQDIPNRLTQIITKDRQNSKAAHDQMEGRVHKRLDALEESIRNTRNQFDTIIVALGKITNVEEGTQLEQNTVEQHQRHSILSHEETQMQWQTQVDNQQVIRERQSEGTQIQSRRAQSLPFLQRISRSAIQSAQRRATEPTEDHNRLNNNLTSISSTVNNEQFQGQSDRPVSALTSTSNDQATTAQRPSQAFSLQSSESDSDTTLLSLIQQQPLLQLNLSIHGDAAYTSETRSSSIQYDSAIQTDIRSPFLGRGTEYCTKARRYAVNSTKTSKLKTTKLSIAKHMPFGKVSEFFRWPEDNAPINLSGSNTHEIGEWSSRRQKKNGKVSSEILTPLVILVASKHWLTVDQSGSDVFPQLFYYAHRLISAQFKEVESNDESRKFVIKLEIESPPNPTNKEYRRQVVIGNKEAPLSIELLTTTKQFYGIFWNKGGALDKAFRKHFSIFGRAPDMLKFHYQPQVRSRLLQTLKVLNETKREELQKILSSLQNTDNGEDLITPPHEQSGPQLETSYIDIWYLARFQLLAFRWDICKSLVSTMPATEQSTEVAPSEYHRNNDNEESRSASITNDDVDDEHALVRVIGVYRTSSVPSDFFFRVHQCSHSNSTLSNHLLAAMWRFQLSLIFVTRCIRSSASF